VNERLFNRNAYHCTDRRFVYFHFSMLREADSAAIQKDMESWLVSDHIWKFNKEAFKVSVDEVILKPQAAGALFDHIITMDGTPNANVNVLKSEVGVISIGYNTIELMVLSGGKQVDRMGGSELLGVRRMLELINRNKYYSLTELDMLLRDDRLNGEMEIHKAAWSEMVTSYISTAWGNTWKRFGKVLVVGGGATERLLCHKMNSYFEGKASVPSEPIQSIARGLYKRGIADVKRKG